MAMSKKKVMFIAVVCVLFCGLSVAALAGPWGNGTIIQVRGSGDAYFVVNGYAAKVPSGKVFKCMGLNKNRNAKVTESELAAMPKTAFLIRGSDGKVYRVDGDIRRYVSSKAVFHSKGFNESEIIEVNDGVFSCIPEGPPIK
jgi:hypothetical protein